MIELNLEKLTELGMVDDEMLVWDGLDDAIVGIVSRCGMENVFVYSVQKIAYILRDRDGMDVEEALEYLDFNIRGAFIGDRTPMLLEDFI